jgi:hypothetical protein
VHSEVRCWTFNSAGYNYGHLNARTIKVKIYLLLYLLFKGMYISLHSGVLFTGLFNHCPLHKFLLLYCCTGTLMLQLETYFTWHGHDVGSKNTCQQKQVQDLQQIQYKHSRSIFINKYKVVMEHDWQIRYTYLWIF